MTSAPAEQRPTATPRRRGQILDAIERWVEKEVRPIARKFDQADEYPHEIVEQMKELGLFGATIGEEYGGLGLSASTYARIVIADLAGLDGADRHLQLAPDHGRLRRSATAPRSRSALPAALRHAASCAAASA